MTTRETKRDLVWADGKRVHQTRKNNEHALASTAAAAKENKVATSLVSIVLYSNIFERGGFVLSNMTFTAEEISALSYHELRCECRRADLHANGTTEALRTRLLEHSKTELDSQPHTKKQKNENESPNNATEPKADHEEQKSDADEPVTKQTKSVADDLICPITHELPFDPVTAEDGRIYERSAIEQHIQSRQGLQLQSPMTNEPMGPRLFPNPQQKNVIHTLVESGVITGDLAEKWNEKVEEEKQMEELIKKAQCGDAASMGILGRNYRGGNNGFKKDTKLAALWFQKAHDAGNVKATASLGFCHLHGMGMKLDVSMALYYFTSAAEKGSNYAAYHLGFIFAYGDDEIRKCPKEAQKWLRQALDKKCKYDHLKSETIPKIHEMLDQLKSELNDDSHGSD